MPHSRYNCNHGTCSHLIFARSAIAAILNGILPAGICGAGVVISGRNVDPDFLWTL
jgi:hypothetical protein